MNSLGSKDTPDYPRWDPDKVVVRHDAQVEDVTTRRCDEWITASVRQASDGVIAEVVVV